MSVLFPRSLRAPAWLGRRRWSPEARAIGATILCTLAIVGAGAMVWVDVRDEPAARDEEHTVAFAESANGRLLFDVSAVAVGSRVVTAETESFRWTELAPASGRLDTGVGRVQVAHGPVAPQALTEARLTFGSVAYMVEGTLHHLPVPQDTLRLRVPGEPGQPGDRLLVVLDVNQSVRVIDELFVFEPFVSEARWLRGDAATTASADETTTPGEGIAPRPSAYVSDSSDDPSNADTDRDMDGDDKTNDPAPPPSDVGKVRLFVRDVPIDEVRTLHATFGRIALDRQDSSSSETFYDGARTVDLRAFAGPDARAELVTFQTKATTYESLRLEFTGATAEISRTAYELAVPQPILVIEKPFVVAPGQTTELLVDFSIEESLVLGTDGWEFRPVAFQFQTSETDLDDDGVHDVADPDDDDDGTPDAEDADRDGDGVPDQKPAQFRTGGSSLPTLGPDLGAPAPEPVEELEEEESRPIGSEGSLPDLPVDKDDVLDKPFKDVKLVGFPVWAAARRKPASRFSVATAPGTP